MDVLADGAWQQFFTVKPEPLTREEKREWLDTLTGVSLGSDAFFPFGDNIERAHRTGVSYIAEPGGSIRDDHVIATCNKYGIAMACCGKLYCTPETAGFPGTRNALMFRRTISTGLSGWQNA